MELAARFSRQTFEDMSIRQLVTWLKERTDEYTNDQPTVSDKVFDLGEKVLKERAPKNKYWGLVGAPVKGPKKVRLPIPMGSLSKVKPADGIEGWLKKAGSKIIVSDKLDGISAQNNNLPDGEKLFTRGDGVNGQDISELLEVVDGMGVLRRGEAVRGELVMAKKKFKGKLAKMFENTRNVVAGVANSTDKAGHVAASSLTFVAYEMLKPQKPLDQAATYLKGKGFDVVKFKVFTNPTVEELIQYFELRKAKSLYELDGLVLESSRAGTVAFKVETEVAQTKVKSIRWELSRHSVWQPTIMLEPVRLSGVTISRASAYNARYLSDMGIGPGATVEVTRSGDVIPKVVRVVKKAKLAYPDGAYEWDANKVHYVLPAEEEEPSSVLTERIANGLLVLGVPGIRSGLVAKLVNADIDTLEDVIKATQLDLTDAGLGSVQADSLRKGLAKALMTVDHPTMMKASGFWPKGIGETIFTKVLNKFSYEAMVKLTPRVLYNTMVDNGVLTNATALKFAKEFKHYKKFVDSVDFTPMKKRVSKNDSLNGVVVAFTGFRNKSLEDIIKARGAKVSSSVRKDTQILLVPTDRHVSAKTKKAEDNGIDVMDLITFLKKHKINL